MEKTILTWNVTNWITVVLMATLGFMVVGSIGVIAKKWRSKKAA
jgi:hypothetical protein